MYLKVKLCCIWTTINITRTIKENTAPNKCVKEFHNSCLCVYLGNDLFIRKIIYIFILIKTKKYAH